MPQHTVLYCNKYLYCNSSADIMNTNIRGITGIRRQVYSCTVLAVQNTELRGIRGQVSRNVLRYTVQNTENTEHRGIREDRYQDMHKATGTMQKNSFSR